VGSIITGFLSSPPPPPPYMHFGRRKGKRSRLKRLGRVGTRTKSIISEMDGQKLVQTGGATLLIYAPCCCPYLSFAQIQRNFLVFGVPDTLKKSLIQNNTVFPVIIVAILIIFCVIDFLMSTITTYFCNRWVILK
jgi:hypothetical protein